jgi:hypothetical protein
MIDQAKAMSNISLMTDYVKQSYRVIYEHVCNSNIF